MKFNSNYFFYFYADIVNTAPDKHKLVKLLAEISHQWYVIGMALKVSDDVLEDLQTSPQHKKVKLNK